MSAEGDQERPYRPPITFRAASTSTIFAVGFLSRAFLYVLSKTESQGLDRFLEILDSRKDESKRERGLITVSNHLSVLDDPMIWGVLPLRYHWNPNNSRWALGSYDIVFKNGGLVSKFFTYGQTLPTQRQAHSEYGGLFQPTMTEAIRLLSDPHGTTTLSNAELDANNEALPPTDPFSAAELTYTTNGVDSFPTPSAYPFRRYSWIHIFPEGMIHQHPQKVMRYFKWGVARLILEAEPCPDVLPMWIDGPQDVMNEQRAWPRPVPRPGKKVSITFGELVNTEAVFGPFREKWRDLREKSRRKRITTLPSGEIDLPKDRLGELSDDFLKYSPEAEQLRIDVTLAIRNEVLKVRRSRGFSDEDPKRGLAATWRKEGRMTSHEGGEMADRSVVKDM